MATNQSATPSSDATSRPLHPESFQVLPARAVRAVTYALAMELLAIDREEAAASRRLSHATDDAAPSQEFGAIALTLNQCSQAAGAIRDFLKRIDPAFAPDFPKKTQPPQPLTPEERAELRALGKPGKEARP